ncbi:Mannonate dehydratase [Candidatus Rhodobacter oscarellae]|uniref:Mannonate dehydratase n=1 Tax=Candidatus Rhodobacter oscarellae TaxID=1675527 RepID=A0A0J9E960_9RHOB|nr:mannonate dehydratase [Candidatus Rhodobacter lobularis]KMW58204.1 Mannonate dehydratase [Candidatus Rhodobacter lobularis]
MIESWRWFGPLDKISLEEVAQTGATGIVTALHEIPYGETWPREAIAARRDAIRSAPGGMDWLVVESLPVHEDIKRGVGNLDALFANYRQSLANLAAEGVKTVCYNFMPLLDWTRTTLDAPVAGGGTALRFEMVEMAAFDVHMLQRAGAQADYTPQVLARAEAWASAADQAERDRLLHAIMAGLPGAYARYDVGSLRAALRPWEGFTADDLRASLKRFLEEVVPTAEELGVRLCTHPDDPPWPILGLPRIVSSEADIAYLLGCVDSPANGLTLCTGALGANPRNDLPAIAQRFRDRIAFTHIRNVARDPDGSFQEAAHLAGNTDIPAVLAVLQDLDIPFRPDHGHELLSDLGRGTHPGYPLIGRMRGLAELRGVLAGLGHSAG